MNLITDLIPQKNNLGRVNVYLDDRYAFSAELLTAGRFTIGLQLTEKEIADYKSQDRRYKALRKAMIFLSLRPRSQLEVEQYLEKNGFSRETIQHTRQRLQTEGYLDDELFATFWIENRIRHKPRGIYALKWELRQKGIDEGIIESKLEGLVENEWAHKCVMKKIDTWHRLSHYERDRKIFHYLKRLGFEYYTIMDTINHFRISQPLNRKP